jgi:hypothetical protein
MRRMTWDVHANKKQFAKLEHNIITAFFIAMFDYELTDKVGNLVSETPPVDFNGHAERDDFMRGMGRGVMGLNIAVLDLWRLACMIFF